MWWIKFYDKVLDILHRWYLKVKAHRDHKIAAVATTKKRLPMNYALKPLTLIRKQKS